MGAEEGGEVDVVEALVGEEFGEGGCVGVGVGEEAVGGGRGGVLAADEGFHAGSAGAGYDGVVAGEDWTGLSKAREVGGIGGGRQTDHVSDGYFVFGG